MYYARTEKEDFISTIVSIILSALITVGFYIFLSKLNFGSAVSQFLLTIILCFVIFLLSFKAIYGIMYLFLSIEINSRKKIIKKNTKKKYNKKQLKKKE